MQNESANNSNDPRLSLSNVAILCGLIPTSTVIVCATWSMQSHLVPTCLPLIDGCLSISAACRSKPVIYFFRLIMLPMSLVLVWFWILNNSMLEHCVPERLILRRSVFILSVTGSLFLILYVLYLGTEGPTYEFLRRIGIYVFFGGAGIAQLVTTIGIGSVVVSLNKSGKNTLSGLIAWKLQLMCVIFMLLAGPLNLVFKGILVDADHVENIIEWNFGLVMFCWYGFHALVHRSIANRPVKLPIS